MTKWPRDNQADLIAFYGDPKRDIPKQLVKVIPPFQMFYDGKPLKHLWFHRKAAPALLAALNEIWEHYKHDQKAIDKEGISDCGGTYNPRYVRGSTTKWSNHAFAAAIDLDAKNNGLYQKGDMPLAVINAFKKQGARWGGDYRGRKDPMHFEFCGSTEYVAPQTFADMAGDNGFDQEANDAEVEANDNIHDVAYKQRDDETRPLPWYKKAWNWVTGGGIASIGGLSFFSGVDWTIVATLGGIGFLVFLVIWFTKLRKE